MTDAPVLDPSNVPVTPPTTTPTTAAPPTTTTEPTTEPNPNPATTEPPKAPEPRAPETYADFAPYEGAPEDFKYDAAALEEAKALFKTADLTQEQAQAVIAAQAKRDQAVLKQLNDNYQTTREGWRADINKTYGNNLKQMQSEVGQALGYIDEPLRKEFFEGMAVTGAGDHPAFVKVFHQLSKLVIEGKPVTGEPPQPAKERKGFANALYPNLP